MRDLYEIWEERFGLSFDALKAILSLEPDESYEVCPTCGEDECWHIIEEEK